MPPHSMYGLGLQEWHVPTFSFLFFSQLGLDELMVMHRHVASKLDTQIFADWERCFGRILTGARRHMGGGQGPARPNALLIPFRISN